MGALTQYYVDPAIAGDSGTGTVGDPYGDLQYALDQVTRDATNGDRFNIKSGTDEILSAALSFATYGIPDSNAPVEFRGYTSASGDGGIGGISGNGTYSIITGATLDAVRFVDMHLHNCGSAAILDLDNDCVLFNCEFDNTSGDGVKLDARSTVINCYFHNIGAIGLEMTTDSCVLFSTFENSINDFTRGVSTGQRGLFVAFNVFDVDGATNAVHISHTDCRVMFNSIYSSSGTGIGIRIGGLRNTAINNIIEGFSGVGGIGLEAASGTGAEVVKGFNAFYNNTTDESITGEVIIDLGNDQSLGSSPFVDAANDDFTVDTSVRALAFPTANYPGISVRSYLDIGALQRQEGLNWATLVRRIPI